MSDMSMFDVDIEARPLEYSLKDYQLAPSGLGEMPAVWANKPHRIVYDLIAAVKYYANEAAKQSIQGEAVATIETYWSPDAGWQYNLKLNKQFDSDKFCEEFESKGKVNLYTHAPDSAARIAELEVQIVRLTKEFEEARKDAERYCMVRSLDVTPYDKWNKAQKTLHRELNSADTTEMVDAAVDAALSKIGGGE